MNTSFFQELLGSIAERGRALVDRSATRPAGKGGRRAKAAGNAGEPLPRPALGPRRGLGRGAGPAGARPLCRLADGGPDRVLPPARQRLRPGSRGHPAGLGGLPARTRRRRNLQALLEAVEPPRQELFRRLNLAPGGTAALVAMREDLLKHGGKEAAAAQGRRRLRASVRLLVQSRLPRAAADRLVDAGRHPGADHPLRGRARDPGLGRPAPPRAAHPTGAASPSSTRR